MSYTMTIRLDGGLLARLEAMSRRKHEPLSTLARRAIVEWLEHEAPRRATTLLRHAGTLKKGSRPATNAAVRAAIRQRRRK